MGKWRFEMANLHKTKFNRGYLFAVNALILNRMFCPLPKQACTSSCDDTLKSWLPIWKKTDCLLKTR